eukprot:g6429.t1
MQNWKQTAQLAYAKGYKYLSTPLVAENLDYASWSPAKSFIEHACGCSGGQCSCQDASCGCPVYVGFHFYAYDCMPEGTGGYETLQERLDATARIMEQYPFVKGAIINEVGMLNCASEDKNPICVPDSGRWSSRCRGSTPIKMEVSTTSFCSTVMAASTRRVKHTFLPAAAGGDGEMRDAPWLLWIGADASFVDFGEDVLRRTLTEYAAEQVQVLISRDPHGRAGNSLSLFNADVILIRRSSWSSQFLQRWWDDPRMKEGWTDQEVLELLYKEDHPVVHLGGHGDTVRLEVFRRALELLCEDQLDRNSLQLQDTYLDSLRRVTTQPEGTSSGHLHSSVSAGHFQRLAWHLEVKGRVQEALAVQEAALQHAKSLVTMNRFMMKPTKQTSLNLPNIFGSSDPQTLLAEVALGTSLRVAGRGSEAAQLLAKSCKKLPARDKFTCVNNLALALGSIGRHQEAEVHFHKAHRGIVKVLGHDSLAAANVAVNLASSMAQRQAHREAEPFYRSAWSTRNASLGATHPETLELQGFLAASLLASGRPREAEQVQRQALPTGASPEVLAQAHSTLGQALRLQGKVSEALEHFRVAYENLGIGRVKRTFQSPPEGNRNPNMFAAASNLASVLQDLGRLDEAAPLYELAVLGLEETLGVDHQNSQGARQNYEKFRARAFLEQRYSKHLHINVRRLA